MPEVTLNVSSKIAKLLEEQSYAEIVFRESNRRFDFFTKELVTKTASESVSAGVAESIEKISANNMRNICNRLDVGFDSISNKLDGIDAATKSMAVNVKDFVKHTQVTNVLSFLNVAVSLVNIGVDIVGFKLISDKLNELNSEMKDIKATVTKLYNATESEKLSDCEKLIMRFNAESDHIQNGEVKDLDVLQNLLIDMNGYLTEMTRDLVNEVFGIESILEILLRVMPAYSMLLSEFLKQYYYKYNRRPNNYDTFVNLYSLFFKQDITDTLLDYFLIQRKNSYIDSTDTLRVIQLLALNGRLQVEDQISLAEALKTEEEYRQVDLELAELASKGVLLSA